MHGGPRRRCPAGRPSGPTSSGCSPPAASPPRPGGADRSFWLRREPGQEHAVLWTRTGDGPERVLLDVVAVDPSGATTLDGWSPSKEGRLLAYQLSTGRRRGVAAAGPRRRHRRAGGRPGRPLPLLPRRLGAGRRRLLLRAPAGPRAGAGGRGAVPPAGAPARRRDAGRRRCRGLGRRPRPDPLLRLLGLARRPVAARHGQRRHRAAGGRLAVRPGRRRPAGRGPGRGGRPVRAVGRAGRPALAGHRPGRAARPALPRRPPYALGVGDRRAGGPGGGARGRGAARRRPARGPAQPARLERGHGRRRPGWTCPGWAR